MRIIWTLALRNLRRHWVRSLLSGLGIVIGVVAIASLGIMGNSISLLVANVITDVGDTQVVVPHSAAAGSGMIADPRTAVSASVPEEQVDIIRRVAGDASVIPVRQGAAAIGFPGGDEGVAQVIGLENDRIPDILDLRDGQWMRENTDSCLVGSMLADEYDLEPGSRITADGQKLRVAGILSERGFAIDINPDYAVVVTENWYTTYIEDGGYQMVVLRVRDISDLDALSEAVSERLNRHDDVVDVIDSRDLLSQYDEIYDQITLFLLGIGAISLIVAAVNIINVMVISVTERTHEIGILRSIGMRRGGVLRMFLYEALLLGLVGSITGGVISAIGGYIISSAAISVFTAGTTFGEGASILNVTAVAYIMFAMLFGILVSLLAGAYPAWTAAQMKPIEALHHE